MAYVQKGDADEVQRLISSGASVKGKQGGNLLISAAKLGHAGVIRVLIKANAEVNTREFVGRKVVALFNVGVREAKWEVGSEMEYDNIGDTALCAAVKNNKLDAVDALLESRSIDVNKRCYKENGRTPLLLALHEVFMNKDPNVVEIFKTIAHALIKDRRVNVNKPDRIKFVALYYAVQADDKSLIDELLGRGSKVNAGPEGSKPLDEAVWRQNFDAVKRLLEAGAFVTQELISKARTPEIKTLLSERLKKQSWFARFRQ
jgi:ankyrin repeat protein